MCSVTPRISVVIPTYNRAAKVGNAIESVLAQTLSDLEVIVVDDGSSDDTEQILMQTFGDKIRYFAQANQGQSVARNRGLKEARGEWIGFLDSDDLWEKDKLEWQFKALEQCGSQCGACYTDVRLMNHPETRTLFEMAEEGFHHAGNLGAKPDVLQLLVRAPGAGMVLFLGSLLARADAIGKTSGFDPNVRFGEDTDFMFRLATVTGFCYVNQPLVRFDRSPMETRHAGVSTDWNKVEFVLEQTRLRLEKFLRLKIELPESVLQLIRKELCSVNSGLTNSYLEAGDYGKAREAVLRAARTNLTLNVALKGLLTWVTPKLARRTVRYHLSRKKDEYPVL
jgi:glycosyltransferase involved in cell wall biosynthesis